MSEYKDVSPEDQEVLDGIQAVVEQFDSALQPYFKKGASMFIRVEYKGFRMGTRTVNEKISSDFAVMSEIAEIGADAFFSAILGRPVSTLAIAIPENEMVNGEGDIRVVGPDDIDELLGDFEG